MINNTDSFTEKQGLLIIKPDSINENLTSEIRSILRFNWIDIKEEYPIEISEAEAIELYKHDFASKKKIRGLRAVLYGIENIVGKNILLVCTSMNGLPIDNELRRIKGEALNPSPNTIRGKLRFIDIKSLDENNVTHIIAKSRIHYHANQSEKIILYNILKRKGFRFGYNFD